MPADVAQAGSLEAYSANVAKAATLLKSWAQWRETLSKLDERLAAAKKELAGQLADRVEEAQFELARIATWLRLQGLKELDSARLSEALARADGLLAGLEGYGEVALSPVEVSEIWEQLKASLSLQEQKGFSLPAELAQGATFQLLQGAASAQRVKLDPALVASLLSSTPRREHGPRFVLYPSGGLPAEPAPRLVAVNRRLLVGDGVLLLLQILVTLWTGLATLYVGKTWGSLTDYLAAIAWGFGATASLKLIYGGLNRALGVNEAR